MTASVDRYDPLDPAVVEDPYPWYRALRDHAPVHYVERDDFYVVTRFDDVVTVLRQPSLFSSELGMGDLMRGEVSPRLARPRAGDVDVAALRILIATDPPDHTTLRRMVGRGFTPRAIGDLESRIRTIAEECVEDLLTEVASGTGDLVRHLAEPLPVLVIAEMLGIPGERRHEFKRWSDDVVGVLSGFGDQDRAQASMLEMFEFFVSMAEQRRRDPADDLVSLLVAGSEDGQLDPMEIVTFCILLLIAGNETTTNLLANVTLVLFERPELLRELRESPERIPAALEETLRYDAPIQALFRRTREATSLAGVDLPEDSTVMVGFASANRDERHYHEPDVFNTGRSEPDHLGFGAGIHLCLGAALARLEAKVALETLLPRVRAMAPNAPASRTGSFILRGCQSIPIGFEA